MQYIEKGIILICILLISFPGKTLSAGSDVCKILFIGSSYFNYNNLPGLFASLATTARKEVYIDASIRNGLYLDDHVKLATTDAKITAQDWDYVVLQGVGSLVAYPETYTRHPVYPALEILKKKLSAPLFAFVRLEPSV